MKKAILVLITAFLLGTIIGHAQDIFTAIGKGNLEQVKSIIEKDTTQINALLDNSYTTLSFASMVGNVEIVNYLISKGALDKIVNDEIKTPIFDAIYSGHLDVVKLLIENGIDTEGSTLGMPLLHWSVLKNHLEITDYLLSMDWDINKKDVYGMTPLHLAVELGYIDMCKLLVDRGADLNIRSNDGGTPLNLSKEANQPEITHFLKSKGAKKASRNFPVVKGKYMSSKHPNTSLELFPPNKYMRIIGPHSGIAIHPNGKEIFWVRGDYSGKIWTMKEVKGKWSIPQIASFSGEFDNSYPCFSHDGKKLYFTSDRPKVKGGKGGNGVGDIWYAKKIKNGWSEALNVGDGLNTGGDEFIASINKNNTIYYTKVFFENGKVCADIYQSKYSNGKHQAATALDTTINSSEFEVGPFISPNGSYLIFGSQRFGEMTTCISFQMKNGNWTPAKNIQYLFAPFTQSYVQGISGDGKYILFSGKKKTNRDIYWVSTKIIENLRPKDL